MGSAGSSLANSGKPARACWCMAAMPREALAWWPRSRPAGGAATFLAADLSSLEEVRRLAGAVQATVGRLEILINNAGIGTAGPRQTSAEGFELRFTVNYLAGFLLTLLLLPLLKNSVLPARIVNVSSAGQQPV